MSQGRQIVKSQITFLYYRDLQPVAAFYQDVMGFDLVEDQEWAKIYRVGGNAYLGIVDEARGFHQVQEENAVLVTLVVDDVFWWREYLESKGVKMLTGVRDVESIQVRCFFCQDPGGYTIEIEQFLRPDTIQIFHRQVGAQ
jgi:predicted enzyme related to lactoylglutathione lyase